MDIELNALRRVAKAAKRYQDKVIQKRTLQWTAEVEVIAAPKETFEIGSAEFELSEALNAWFRLQESTNQTQPRELQHKTMPGTKRHAIERAEYHSAFSRALNAEFFAV